VVARRRSAGFSMLEATIALVLIAVVATSLVGSGPRQVRATATAFRAAAARRVAESVLETVPRTAPAAGSTAVPVATDVPLSDVSATRHVRRIDDGLWEVEAVVSWHEPGEGTPRTARLVTWIAAEDAR